MADADGELPPALLNRPSVDHDVAHVWEAHQALAGDRSENGQISFVAIDRYAARYGIEDGDEFQFFHRLLMAMDAEFAMWRAEEAERSKPGQDQHGRNA